MSYTQNPALATRGRRNGRMRKRWARNAGYVCNNHRHHSRCHGPAGTVCAVKQHERNAVTRTLHMRPAKRFVRLPRPWREKNLPLHVPESRKRNLHGSDDEIARNGSRRVDRCQSHATWRGVGNNRRPKEPSRTEHVNLRRLHRSQTKMLVPMHVASKNAGITSRQRTIVKNTTPAQAIAGAGVRTSGANGCYTPATPRRKWCNALRTASRCSAPAPSATPMKPSASTTPKLSR